MDEELKEKRRKGDRSRRNRKKKGILDFLSSHFFSAYPSYRIQILLEVR